MIDVNTPSTLGGILLVLLILFVVITALITTGLLPIVLALAVGGAAVYLAYIVLIRIHSLFRNGSLRRSRGGDS